MVGGKKIICQEGNMTEIMARLHPNFLQAMFYESENQILTLEGVKGCMEGFLFEKLRIESNPSVSSVRRNLAGNISASLMNKGFSELREKIKKATGEEKEKLVDQQILMISEAVAQHLSTSKVQPEKMMLEILLGS
jgi:hypothetical protein